MVAIHGQEKRINEIREYNTNQRVLSLDEPWVHY